MCDDNQFYIQNKYEWKSFAISSNVLKTDSVLIIFQLNSYCIFTQNNRNYIILLSSFYDAVVKCLSGNSQVINCVIIFHYIT